MTKDQLVQMLITNHNDCATFINSLTDEQFVFSYNGKWSAGQQLAHLILCLKPISNALSSADITRQKFPPLDRVSMNYDQVITFYKKGLLGGGKAPEKYLPLSIGIDQRESLRQELAIILSTIKQQLSGYSEADLNVLCLPHPFLGLLSIRELFYLMSYHPLHHLAQVKEHINAAV